MKIKLKRIFYVTPTNFVELLKGYAVIIRKKKQELSVQINKLSTGLGKLEDAAEQVRDIQNRSQIIQEEAVLMAE
jgi:dynein heavy chain